MPDLDPRECLSPDEAELRELYTALHEIRLQAEKRGYESIAALVEDALIEGDAARCLAERER